MGQEQVRNVNQSEAAKVREWLLKDAERLEARAAELRRLALLPDKVPSRCPEFRHDLWRAYRDALIAFLVPRVGVERAAVYRIAFHLVGYDLGPKGYEVVPLDQRDGYLRRARGFVPALFDWADVRMPDRTRDLLEGMVERVSLD